MDIRCTNCGAEIQVDDSLATTNCPFCSSSSIVERPPSQVDRPEFAIGFSMERPEAMAKIRAWLGDQNILKINTKFIEDALETELRAIYLPAYMLGGQCDAKYSASIGEDYTVYETYTDSKGNTHTRSKTKTEWRSLEGNFTEYMSDILVTASRGIANDTLEQIEPFDYSHLRRFDPRITSGWTCEIPTLSRQEAIKLALKEYQGKLRQRVVNHMPGDKLSNLKVSEEFSKNTLILLLVPIWSLRVAKSPKDEPIHLLINGDTGRCGGEIPYSTWKVTLLVLSIIGALGYLGWLFFDWVMTAS